MKIAILIDLSFLYLAEMAETGLFFKWSERMSVQSSEIDEQHKKLIDMLNELFQAFMDKDHTGKIGSIIQQMADYTVYHFNTEEKYFTLFRYPEKHQHMMEHMDFKNKVEEFRQKYQKNNGALTYDVMSYLKGWLNRHIMDTDQKYVECFTRNGVK